MAYHLIRTTLLLGLLLGLASCATIPKTPSVEKPLALIGVESCEGLRGAVVVGSKGSVEGLDPDDRQTIADIAKTLPDKSVILLPPSDPCPPTQKTKL